MVSPCVVQPGMAVPPPNIRLQRDARRLSFMGFSNFYRCCINYKIFDITWRYFVKRTVPLGFAVNLDDLRFCNSRQPLAQPSLPWIVRLIDPTWLTLPAFKAIGHVKLDGILNVHQGLSYVPLRIAALQFGTEDKVSFRIPFEHHRKAIVFMFISLSHRNLAS